LDALLFSARDDRGEQRLARVDIKAGAMARALAVELSELEKGAVFARRHDAIEPETGGQIGDLERERGGHHFEAPAARRFLIASLSRSAFRMNLERSVSPLRTAVSSIAAIGFGNQNETNSLASFVTLPRFISGVILSLIKQVKHHPESFVKKQAGRFRGSGVLQALRCLENARLVKK
jgi:hypothetical protein